ncbi:MAG: hypothetical protein SNJ29_11165 [Rikenellaceae bacterium]
MIAKIWKDPVWSKVISTVILGSFAYLCNLWSNGWVLLALKTAWSWIVAFLFFEIAIIWIICGFIGLILILFLYAKLTQKSPESATIPFLSYTADVFGGYKYRWSYFKGYSGKYEIENLHLICSKCETPMMNDWGGYSCPRCQNRVDEDRLKNNNEIIVLITDNIRRDNYKKS